MTIDGVTIAVFVGSLLFTGLVTHVAADCDVDGLRCCVSEFYSLVDAQSGFNLEEETINRSCIVVDDTFQCLSAYEEDCTKNLKPDDMFVIDATKKLLTDLCSPGSDISEAIKKERQCIMATSKKLRSCAAKRNFKEDVPWSKPCCDYKMLKSCSESTIKENCGDEVMVTVRNLVERIDGLGYETVCPNYYDTCGNSAGAMFSTAVIFLSIAFGTFNSAF